MTCESKTYQQDAHSDISSLTYSVNPEFSHIIYKYMYSLKSSEFSIPKRAQKLDIIVNKRNNKHM